VEKPFLERSPSDFRKGQSSQPGSHHLHAASSIPGNIYLPFAWVNNSLGSAFCIPPKDSTDASFSTASSDGFETRFKKADFHQFLK